jgi:major inositol transporter-like SP family MFS transporter
VRRVFLIGVGVAIVMQATGVNSIMYYGTQILTTSGFGRETALIANIANGVISVAATCAGIFLLGRVGRRPMFLAGFTGTTLSMLLIGLCSELLPVSELRAGLILCAMASFLCFMQGLIAPVSWVLLSELFPLGIRGFAVGFAGCVLWMVNFTIGLLFPSLVAGVGISATFFIFFALGLVSIAFVKRCLPETKGRSLEAIEADFRRKYATR